MTTPYAYCRECGQGIPHQGPCSREWTWEQECIHWRGRVLVGKHAHYCEDWDGLPIDETCGDLIGNGEWPCACNVGMEYRATLKGRAHWWLTLILVWLINLWHRWTS